MGRCPPPSSFPRVRANATASSTSAFMSVASPAASTAGTASEPTRCTTSAPRQAASSITPSPSRSDSSVARASRSWLLPRITAKIWLNSRAIPPPTSARERTFSASSCWSWAARAVSSPEASTAWTRLFSMAEADMAASTRETAMSSTEKSRTSVSARYSTPSMRPRSFKGTRRQPWNRPSPRKLRSAPRFVCTSRQAIGPSRA